MDEREHHKRKERSDLIWTFIIVGAFLTAWPIGVVLAILKGRHVLPDIAMNLSTGQKDAWSEAQPDEAQPRRAQDWADQAKQQADRARQQSQYWAEQARQQAERTRQKAAQWAVPVQNQKPAQPQEKSKRFKKLRFGKPMFVLGLCIGGVGLFSLTQTMSAFTGLRAFFKEGLFPTGLVALGIYLTVYGLLRTRQSRRLQEYASIIQPNHDYYAIHALSDRTGRPYRQVLSDLQKMVELRYWPQAWIDRKHGRLMFTEYSAESPEPPKEDPAPQRDDRAEQVLARIRHDNDLIQDEAISRKIDRIELVTGEIFRYLAKHPEREGELRTFMDYYLPQTLKILETYAQLEVQGVETENIRKAKAQISAMLDQLTESYERQLDKLFDTDVLDISADIEVMRQMLRSEGLTPDELTLKK